MRFALAASFALLLTACGASEPESAPGAPIRLLLRRPDATLEQPAAIVPVGDVASTATWGVSEGPGWSQTLLKRPDGIPYRITNQSRASLILPAVRPVERELVLAAWRASEGAHPLEVLEHGQAPFEVLLNGIALLPKDWRPTPEPALKTFHVPAEAWVLGENLLEFVTPVQDSHWATLALASVSYGPEARVALDPRAGTARFVDGTGARYLVEPAAPATLVVAGTSSARGTLTLRTGSQERRAGERSLDAEAHTRTLDGAFTYELELAPRSGSSRLVELDWNGPGATLELTRLDLVERTSVARPPIVLISIDTFSARHLKLFGYGRPTSPELEAFARDAVVFRRALTNAPWTLPSYLALHSGMYPRAHRVALDFQEDVVVDNFDWWQLAPNRLTLAEALRARGYRTGAFVDTFWLSPQFGFGQGFDRYDGQAALAPFSDPEKHVQRIVDELVPAWLAEGGKDAPPFLFVHALDAHGPYWPNAPHRDRFVPGLEGARTLVRAGSINQTYCTMPSWMARTVEPDESVPLPPEVGLEEVVARYDESLLKIDAYLGKLFRLLRERGLYDDALIVVTGDHGEFFGPQVYGHGVMEEAVLHVPLVVKWPRNLHAGTQEDDAVALVDVYPTLLEAAGVPLEGLELEGRSLRAALQADGAAAERAIFSEGGHVEQYALTLGRWRLIEERPGAESGEASLLTHPSVRTEWLQQHAPELLSRPLDEPLLKELLARPGLKEAVQALRKELAGPYHRLHDLEADPTRDVAPEHPEVVARLLPLLEEHRARARRSAESAVSTGFRPSLPDSARDALEALGYGGK